MPPVTSMLDSNAAVAVLTFALSTMFSYSYYGRKCVSYTFGTNAKNIYNWIYVFMIVIASVASIDIAINFVDSAYALMVIPTMIGTLLLSPKVIAESKKYFSKFIAGSLAESSTDAGGVDESEGPACINFLF